MALVGGAVGVLLGLKKMGQVSASRARELCQQGARVIDVRSSGEYQARHLAVAENIPLDVLGRQVESLIPDKDTVLLLHCLSGTRSGMARRTLQGMGYNNVHNLGSYARAEGILNSFHKPSQTPPPSR